MEIIRIPRIMKDVLWTHVMHGRTIGFVPTMGALHEGHLSLIKMSKLENNITVVSIYVNPKQFGPSEDFNKYPRVIEEDTEKLRKEEIDILFLPDDSHMYPKGFSTYVEVEGISERLCGAFRPGHFRGAATVVAKLFNIINPKRAYFGQKDFQQALIIKKLVRDLEMGIDVIVCPTIREEDGLARSSRNKYLSGKERNAATVICRALKEASDSVGSGIIEAEAIKKIMMDRLISESLVSEIQYCSVYEPETLDELEVIEKEALLAIALKIGNTRLIDNALVTVSRQGKG